MSSGCFTFAKTTDHLISVGKNLPRLVSRYFVSFHGRLYSYDGSRAPRFTKSAIKKIIALLLYGTFV